MSESTVSVCVSGFSVEAPEFEDDELVDVARVIASDIGSALSSLGQWATHGRVSVEVESREASSDD